MRRLLLTGVLAVAALVGGSPQAAPAVKNGDRCSAADRGKTRNGLTCTGTGANRAWIHAGANPAGPSTTLRAATSKGADGPALSKEPVLLGVAIAQTGSTTTELAQDQTVGVRLAEKYFNEHGGVNGHPLKLDVKDTGGDDGGAVAAFKTLIDDGVVGIVGPSLSQQAFAAEPLAEKAKVPVIGPSTTAPNVPQIGDYMARVSPGVANYALAAVRFADSVQPIGRVAVFYAHDDAFSRSEAVIFQNVIKATGIELLPPQPFASSERDFAQQIAFVESARPDLVVISGLPSAGTLVKRLRDAGYAGVVVGGNGLSAAQTFAACQLQCDGLLLAQAYSPELPATGINAEWRMLFKADQNREPDTVAAQAFTAVQVFVEALKATDKDGGLGRSPETVRVELNRHIRSGQYSTPLGDISFDPVGEIHQQNFYIAQVKMLRATGGNDYSGRFVYVRI
jgi:branched-chain amino acid transport system substrate-binding protein